MAIKPRAIWARLRDSLWFVPSAVGLGGVALAIGMVELSVLVDQNALARYPRLFGASADSSRSLLSAIAGSVITVASVTFSLTMVAVAQASGQYTSRVLRTFMRDRVTQVVLGTFIGVFAYCVLVLRTIRSVNESRFVPSLAVVLGIVLALGGMGTLIYFIHHIAATLQASHLLERVGRETIAAVDRLFPDDVAHEATANQRSAVLARLRDASWQPIAANRTGYLQGIDGDRLVRTAESHDVVVRLGSSIGEFVIEGTPIAWMANHDGGHARDAGSSREPGPDARRDRDPRHDRDSRDDRGSRDDRHSRDDRDSRRDLCDSIAGCFTVGTYRTIEEDAGFGVRQIVDIALKALSPGVNDTTTGVTCVDWLGAVLVRLANREIETPFRSDGDTVRVIAPGPSFDSLLALAVDEIRQNAAGNVSVLVALLEMIGRVMRATDTAARRRLLETHARLVAEAAARHVEASHDRERIDRLTAAVLAGG